ncbi:TatD family hydrolase [uncultured Thiodictyon sp.]|uniref:TatD family hydrolase n=1 Tax=uncultured Thiodictyon sp. TaxID=1846217 RepID=UPI0025D5082B|nr:TatD family hydrolase [uncultured Thiodictyon sp.]
MLIDSHCHLDRVDLTPYAGDFARLMAATREAGVSHLLCVSIDLPRYGAMRALIAPYPQVAVSVGVHPNESAGGSPSVADLVALAADPRNVAIGETGLDYFRSEGDLEWQRERFRTHIAAARTCAKPLIIHMRDARQDCIRILREEGADAVGGVLHCFTEDWETARQGLDLGFYVSFSGIVTFKAAAPLREVARQVPLERLLIETDSPYLAPAPHRGKPNEPRFVAQVAACIAQLRGIPVEELARVTSENYFRLFGSPPSRLTPP